MSIGALLGGFAEEKQRQHQRDYDNEMSERQLRLSVLMKAADNPDITLEERKHILNEAGTMMGTPAVKGLFGRTKKKASQPIALGDLLMGDLSKQDIVGEGTSGAQRVDTPSQEPSTFTPPQQNGAATRPRVVGTNAPIGMLAQPETITLEPPPGMFAIQHGQRTTRDIQQQQETNQLREQYRLKEQNDAASDKRRKDERVEVANINAAARTQATKLRTDAAENKNRNQLMRTFLNEVNGGDESDPVAVAEAYRRADDYQSQYNKLRLNKTQSEIGLNESRSSLNKEMARSIPQRLEIMRENTRIGWTRVQVMDRANQIKEIELRTPDFKVADARARRDVNSVWTPTWIETKTNDYTEDELQEMRDAGTLTPQLEQAAGSGDNSAVGRLAQLQREARNRAAKRVELERGRYEEDRRADEILKMDEAKRGGSRGSSSTSEGGGSNSARRNKLGWRNKPSSSPSTSGPSTSAQGSISESEIRAMMKDASKEQIQKIINKAKTRGQLVDAQGNKVQ